MIYLYWNKFETHLWFWTFRMCFLFVDSLVFNFQFFHDGDLSGWPSVYDINENFKKRLCKIQQGRRDGWYGKICIDIFISGLLISLHMFIVLAAIEWLSLGRQKAPHMCLGSVNGFLCNILLGCNLESCL